MDEAKAWGATALNVLSAPLFSFNRRIVFEQAAALRLPAIYEWPEMAEEGGLIAHGRRLNRSIGSWRVWLSRSSAAPSRKTSRSNNLPTSNSSSISRPPKLSA